MTDDGAQTGRTSQERETLLAFLDEHRRLLRTTVLVLSDEEARRSLVPSLTTPMGLLKHAAFVETAWFACRFGGLTRAQAGIPETVDESFTLTPTDTLTALADRHEAAVRRADEVIAALELEATCIHPVLGDPRGAAGRCPRARSGSEVPTILDARWPLSQPSATPGR